MDFTGEQFIPGGSSKRIEEDHAARYEFLRDRVTGKIVLDVACGTGYGVKMIKNFGAARVYGVDISPEAIKFARERYFGLGIEYLEGDAGNMPFEDHFFDLVVSFETIEHLNDSVRDAYLKDIYRILKNGGRYVLSTPNKIVTSPFSAKPLNRYHFREYRLRELLALLRWNGFEIEEIFGQRMVNKFFANLMVRRLVRLFEVFTGRRLGLYEIANGPQVMAIKNFQPRYFVLVAKK